MSKSRIPVFIVCPQCSGTEMAYPARRERRKKDISSWSMVIPFHSQQFTVGQIDRGEWWCSRCDKSAQQGRAVDPPLADGTRTDSRNMFVSPESRTDGTSGN